MSWAGRRPCQDGIRTGALGDLAQINVGLAQWRKGRGLEPRIGYSVSLTMIAECSASRLAGPLSNLTTAEAGCTS